MIDDLTKLSPEEVRKLPIETFELWLKALDDIETPSPSEYPLGSNEGRCGFLESYIWFGEENLFEAVNHIWNSMREPKNTLCIYIGMYAGSGGSGKWALAKFLRRALRETLDFEMPQPGREPGQTLDEFHRASMDYFAADRAHYERSIQKYADILNGEPGRHQPHSAEVIKGPWRALPSGWRDRTQIPPRIHGSSGRDLISANSAPDRHPFPSGSFRPGIGGGRPIDGQVDLLDQREIVVSLDDPLVASVRQFSIPDCLRCE